MHIAQTNMQLFRQARKAGYAADDILTLRRDYGAACQLHGALTRHSGKPFLSHLVGTASALIHENQPLTVIRAGLNHAAYDHGCFPSGASGAGKRHRRWLRAQLGDEVEALIHGYTEFEFSPQRVKEWASQLNALPNGHARDLMIMRLANEVDDGIDYSPALMGNPRWRDPSYLEALNTLSRALGLNFCADIFEQVAVETEDAEWLTPSVWVPFAAHRPSVLSYGKVTLRAWGKKLLKPNS